MIAESKTDFKCLTKNLQFFLLSHISYSIEPKIHKEKLIMKNDNIFYLSKGFEREKFLRYL